MKAEPGDIMVIRFTETPDPRIFERLTLFVNDFNLRVVALPTSLDVRMGARAVDLAARAVHATREGEGEAFDDLSPVRLAQLRIRGRQLLDALVTAGNDSQGTDNGRGTAQGARGEYGRRSDSD